MGQRLKFKARQDGRIVSQSKIGQFFTIQLKSARLPQILRQFIQRFSLGDYGQVEALGDELTVALENVNLYNFLHPPSW